MHNVLQDKKTIVPKMLLAVSCKQRESFLDELDRTIFFSFKYSAPQLYQLCGAL